MRLLLKFQFFYKVKADRFLRRLVMYELSSKKSTFNMSNISRHNFITFEDMISNRKEEARKSIFIEVPTKEHLYTLHSLCTKFGKVQNIFGTRSSMGKLKWIGIVQFTNEDSVEKIIEKAHTNMIKEPDYSSILLPFLNLRDDSDVSSEKNLNKDGCTIHFEKMKSYKDILNHIQLKCCNLSEQIQYFYDETKMTEIGWRLRFLACRKIEWALPRVLSHVKVLPFGSSVNTFGGKDCDVDMVMDFGLESPKSHSAVFPFYLQYKKRDISSRNYVQKNLELISEMISFYMPGFENVTRILNANVPIIKCKESFTDLDCDITLGNKSGFYMSELLYIYGCSDSRVRPLVFILRWWAKEKGLTQKGLPGRWFSNFTTTLLVLFFLMNTRPTHVIPPLKLLQKLSGKSFTCEGITYSFLRDVTRLPASSNEQNLADLLEGFFSFYAEFDFRKNAISVITGKVFSKPSFSPLYIQNPVENELNVSRNVVKSELEAFKRECVLALSTIEEKGKNSDCDMWGLLSLVSNSQQEDNIKVKDRRSFDVDIKSLFEKTKSVTPSFTEKSRQTKLKNNDSIQLEEVNNNKIDRIPLKSKNMKYEF